VSILTYTVRGTRPRAIANAGDKTALTTRSNTAGSWQTWYDGSGLSQADGYLTATDATLTNSEAAYNRFLLLALYGWIEGTTSYHTKLLSSAKYLAQHPTIWEAFISRRFQILALSYAYDFLDAGVIAFADADKKIIGDALQSLCTANAHVNLTTGDYDEYLDGHSAGNLMSQMVAGIVLSGESGTGFNYSTFATTQIDEALNFFYGASASDPKGLDVMRYFGGAQPAGTWYSMLRTWKFVHALQAIRKGMVQNSETAHSLQLNGTDYNPDVDEDWIASAGEYILHSWLRGDDNFWAVNDSQRVTNPWLHDYTRHPLSWLVALGGTWRKSLRWLLDTLNAKTAAVNQLAGYQQVFDFFFYDPSDTDNASVHPKDASPAIAKTIFANPPGSLFSRSSWDYKQAAVLSWEIPERYYMGHPHLLVGGMQVAVRQDLVLTHSGFYSTSDPLANYGALHHRQWYQQSISQSGIPLVDDGVTTHQNYNATGSLATYQTGLGGQVWMAYDAGGGVIVRDPQNLSEMLMSGGGEAFHRAISRMPANTSEYTFAYCDSTFAYCGDYQIRATSRVPLCHLKLLIIHAEGAWPVYLYVCRVQSRQSSFQKRVCWHSYGAWAQSFPHASASGNGDCYRHTAYGYLATSAPSNPSGGKIALDTYTPSGSGMVFQQFGGAGTPNAAGYYPQQFFFGGTNYPPTYAPNSRWIAEVGRYTLQALSPATRTEETFAFLIQPMGKDDAPLAYSWVDENDYIGITFTDTGHTYKIAREEFAVLAGTGGEESGPPAAPTGLVASPGILKATVSWSPNTESDISSYRVYYREKVI
jgi:hypothetical protein